MDEDKSRSETDHADVEQQFNSTESDCDNFSNLPIELSTFILGFLDVPDLLEASRVSKRWRAVVNMDVVWRRICTRNGIQNENFPHELGVGEPPGGGGWCRWARVFRMCACRRKKWKLNEYSDLCPQLDSPARSFGVHGTTIAIGHWGGGLTVYSNAGDDLLTAQVFNAVPEVRDVQVALDSLVMLVDDWIVLKRLRDGKFAHEAVFHAETEKKLDDASKIKELQNSSPTNEQFVCSKILLVTRASVWLRTGGLKIFLRADQTFVNYNINPITDIKSNQNWVAILRPDSIDLYQHNGTFVYSIQSSSYFYTGLVMSHVGLAFLESLDFDGPNAAYVDLHSREKTVIGANANFKLKVYRLTLFQSTVYCLSGRAKFELSYHESNGVQKFSVPVMGSKYLRPGKEFFEIVCSKFIFISPAQFRLDLFELYDKDTGDKVLAVSIQTSSYNIAQVSDAGLVLKMCCVKHGWTESGLSPTKAISCRSMTCKIH